jgi:P27 family predicted phage terminase small subunit
VLNRDSPAAPTWLGDNAKAEWRRVAPVLHSRGVVGPDTMRGLEAYCVAVGQMRDCESLIRLQGLIIAGANGPVPHPAVKVQQSSMRLARQLAADLGLGVTKRPVADAETNAWAEGLLA